MEGLRRTDINCQRSETACSTQYVNASWGVCDAERTAHCDALTVNQTWPLMQWQRKPPKTRWACAAHYQCPFFCLGHCARKQVFDSHQWNVVAEVPAMVPVVCVAVSLLSNVAALGVADA